jgi:formylglycine-generating enzyme required for sulfatase activity
MDIEMARIGAGTVMLHDARRKVRWSVELEPFEIGVYPVTEEQLAELLGETANHPRRLRPSSRRAAIHSESFASRDALSIVRTRRRHQHR